MKKWWTAAERWVTYHLGNKVLFSCRPYIQYLSSRRAFCWCIHTPLELAWLLRGIDRSPITVRRLSFPYHWIQRRTSSRATDVTWHCTETNHSHVKWSWHSRCGILYNSLLSSGRGSVPIHVRSNRQEMDTSSNSMVGRMGARRTHMFFSPAFLLLVVADLKALHIYH